MSPACSEVSHSAISGHDACVSACGLMGGCTEMFPVLLFGCPPCLQLRTRGKRNHFFMISFIQREEAPFCYNLPYDDASFYHTEHDFQKSVSPYSRPLTIQGQAQRENRKKEIRKSGVFLLLLLLVADGLIQWDGRHCVARRQELELPV